MTFSFGKVAAVAARGVVAMTAQAEARDHRAGGILDDTDEVFDAFERARNGVTDHE